MISVVAQRFSELKMTKPLSIMRLAAVTMAGSAAVGHALEGVVAKATTDAFDARLFAGAPEKKAYACFMRHYDADHLARHPKQKVSAMRQDAGRDVRLGCGVDCEGGGIDVALSRDDRSAIVRLDRITVWQRNKPDDEAGDALLAGADDKIFRLDRADSSDCAALLGRPQGTRGD